MSTISTVEVIKASLSKLLPADSLTPESVEQCQDMLNQLENCDITFAILTKSLIGTVVSKFKGHEEVGPMAKPLLKKWKKVAKEATAAAAAAKPAPAERRESMSTSAAEEEWAGLQPYRQTICKKLHSFLKGHKPELVKQGINGTAVDHLVVERATEVEIAIHKKYRNDKQDYLSKARSLCFNIKKNGPLATQITLGQIAGDELVSMTSEELASDEKRKEMEERLKAIMESKRLDWDQANEGKINEMCGIRGDLLSASLFTCDRCKSVKTTSTQKQTRSADEPMTVFVFCLNCGKRWKC
jgi:transcription elongation factor S-II